MIGGIDNTKMEMSHDTNNGQQTRLAASFVVCIYNSGPAPTHIKKKIFLPGIILFTNSI
jgi:hypothetical protein